jgi:hypothetical protein
VDVDVEERDLVASSCVLLFEIEACAKDDVRQ